jgi:hypothetical protein
MIAEALRHVLFILAFRSLPFAAYVGLSRSVPVLARGGVAVAYLCIAGCAQWLGQSLLLIAAGSGYYLLLACLVPRCTLALRTRRVTPGGLFVSFAVVYLVLPGIFAPGMAQATFLVLGWDLLMSSYSYCIDVAAMSRAPQLRDCLFFLMVNPTVNYSNSGHRVGTPSIGIRSASRVLLGASTMFLSSAFLRPACRAIAEHQLVTAWIANGVAYTALFGGIRLLAEYAAHSGLASIQIGFMGLIGYRVPERYQFPLLADSPLDFWRRWNTYVGSWLNKYAFIPLARRLQRSAGPWAKAVALMVTFLVSGLLHDGYTYTSSFVISTRHQELFIVSALTVLLWLGAARLLRRGVPPSPARARSALSAVASRLAVLTTLVLTAAMWGR